MRTTKICNIDGCVRKHYARGLCTPHLKRLRRHGDPLVVARENHGLSHLPEYSTWQRMRARCYKAYEAQYMNYGGRGIGVCERWRNSFVNFLEDMGRRPSSNHSIERIDVNGNYEPSNCRWATSKEQQNNRRNNHLIEHLGTVKTMQQWCDEYGLPNSTVYNRLARGLPSEKVFELTGAR